MKYLFRLSSVLFLGLFLASTMGISLVFAQNINLPCPPVCGPPPSDSVTYLIRNGSASISGTKNLQGSGTSIDITPDSGTTSPITVDARSVISVLRDIASSDPSLFSISHMGYSDFGTPYAGGLYIKCASVSGAAVNPSCDNWQYLVNGSSPAVGVGLTPVANTNSILLYFGPSRRITPSASTVTVGTPFTVTAETYVASSDSWTPAIGFIMKILQGDPFGSPTIVSSAMTGADGTATFTINAAGSYSAGLSEDFYFPNASITASAVPAPSPSTGGGGGGLSLHAPFDVPAALAFLEKAQKADGSFESPLLSDWAAIAFAIGGAGDAQKKLSQYMIANPPVLQSIPDFERHAMALQALGINPYAPSTGTGTSTDYISPIVHSFDGAQIGDSSLVNDDIFAIFPLLHAGYTGNDQIIQKTIAFIISKQLANGSWENSADMTAAAIQALSLVRQLTSVQAAITTATAYLHAQEQSNGGFNNSFSTSWVLQAITALSDSQTNWSIGYSSPQYYLATMQQTDGGVEPASADLSTRVWATEYAIPGVAGKTWDALLSSFSKPVPQEIVQTATTTAAVATSTTVATDIVPAAPRPIVKKAPPATNATEEETAPVTEAVEAAPAESTSPPEANPPLAETPAQAQVAAVATVSSDPREWLLAILLFILLSVLAVLAFPKQFRFPRKPAE